MNIIITTRIGKIRCRYPSTKNGNGLTINAPLQRLIKEGRPEFCWRCGQAFDWSDETESENNEKGTTVESGYDAEGRWHLKLRKAKGKFTLDEIIEAAKEWEEDYYAVIIKAMSDETAQYYDDDLEGDYVTLYRATDFISKEV